MIEAECHSDDHVVEIKFDATPWFVQASEQDLLALAGCGWGGNYPADAVADFFGENETSRLFSYLQITRDQRADPSVGFECHVDPDHAKAWIREHRPALIPKITDLEDDR